MSAGRPHVVHECKSELCSLNHTVTSPEHERTLTFSQLFSGRKNSYAGYVPLSTRSQPPRLSTIVFFAGAVLTGLFVQHLLFGPPLFSASSPLVTLPSVPGSPISEPFLETCSATTTVPTPYLRPGVGNAVFSQEDEWTRSRIDEMIQRTTGFLARDWPLHLGWNNVSAHPECDAPFFSSAVLMYVDSSFDTFWRLAS